MQNGSLVVCLLASLLVAECATWPKNPVVRERLDAAQGLFDKGQYIAGQDYLENSLIGLGASSPELKQIQTLIRRYPEYRPEVTAAIERDTAKSLTHESAYRTLKRINAAAKSGAINSADIKRLRQSLDDALVSQITQGTLKLDLAGLKDTLSVTPSPEVRAKVLENSLELLKGTMEKRPDNLGMLVCDAAKAAGENSDEMNQLRSVFPFLKLRRNELKCLASMLPDEAQARLANVTVQVNIVFDPPDRLMLEDVTSNLKNCEHICIADKIGPGVIEVRIAKLQYDVRQEPERSQTIMYAQHQINLLSAALLMPRNATYQYEYVTGGAQIAYAYEIKAKQDDKTLLDKLLRDSLRESYSYCQNARIQNVFGAVQPANFVANDDMANRCRGNSSPVKPEDLQKQVIDKLADEIKSIDAIKKLSK